MKYGVCISLVDGDEIYNPFTPVVSPTIDDESQLPIDNIFIQMDHGYRSLEHQHSHKLRQYRKHQPFILSNNTNSTNALSRENGSGNSAMVNANYLHQHHHHQHHHHGYRGGEMLTNTGSNAGSNGGAIGSSLPVAHNDTCCLLDSEYYR